MEINLIIAKPLIKSQVYNGLKPRLIIFLQRN